MSKRSALCEHAYDSILFWAVLMDSLVINWTLIVSFTFIVFISSLELLVSLVFCWFSHRAFTLFSQ